MGKPTRLNGGDACCDAREVSGGTETSNYPEEKKSTEIPLVVANERGIAQTAGA